MTVDPTPPGADVEEVPDFDGPTRRVRFRIDGEEFEGPRTLPAVYALRFIAKAERWERDDPERAAQMLPELFADVLLPESLERFNARMADQDNPIGIAQVTRLVPWLFATYADRPTGPSPNSSTGPASPAAGMSSTDGQPASVSTLPVSPSPDS